MVSMKELRRGARFSKVHGSGLFCGLDANRRRVVKERKKRLKAVVACTS